MKCTFLVFSVLAFFPLFGSGAPLPATEPTSPSPSSVSRPEAKGLPSAALAGILAASLVLLTAIMCVITGHFRRRHRRRCIRAAEIEAALDIPDIPPKKTIEFLTPELEASSNPWRFSPVEAPGGKLVFPEGLKKALLKAEKVGGCGVLPSPIIQEAFVAATPVTRTEKKPIEEKGKGKSQGMEKKSGAGTPRRKRSLRGRLSAMVSVRAGVREIEAVENIQANRKSTPSWTWPWGSNSATTTRAPSPTTSRIPDRPPASDACSINSQGSSVEDLVGVGTNDRRGRSNSKRHSRKSSRDPIPSLTLPTPPTTPARAGAKPKLRSALRNPFNSTSSNLGPPLAPPPRVPLPAPPVQMAPPLVFLPTTRRSILHRNRGGVLPALMTIPIPSATAAATAHLATFTLLRARSSLACPTPAPTSCTGTPQSCTFDDVDFDIIRDLGLTLSPVSARPPASAMSSKTPTRYTYSEGLSPISSSCSPTSACTSASQTSSSLWSCYSIGDCCCGSAGGNSSNRSSSRRTVCMSRCSLSPPPPPPPPPTRVSTQQQQQQPPAAAAKEKRKHKPAPLILPQSRATRFAQSELNELPPSPRRLPEEADRVRRELGRQSRERERETVLRRMVMLGDVGGTPPPTSAIGFGAGGGRRADESSVSGRNVKLYGQPWPVGL